MNPSVQPGLILVTAAVAEVREGMREIAIAVDRRTLAKRLWRGTAEDGVEFGFELQKRLTHGAIAHQANQSCYVLRQHPEPCLVVPFENLPPSAVAGISWAVGNLHLEFSSDLERMVTPDEPAARRLLERLGITFQTQTLVFRAGHFKRHAAAPQELGTSHRHDL